MAITTLTRRATLTWLEAVRLPLTAAERVAQRAGQQDAVAQPALAFATFEASVKETIGRLTGDLTLQDLARLQRAELAQRSEALTKKAEAAATRTEVLSEADQRARNLERERVETERKAAEREQQAERDRLAAQQKVAAQAAKKEAATREAARKREQLIADQARQAEADRLQAEAEALTAKERAVRTQGEVLKLDKAVQAKKTARKNG